MADDTEDTTQTEMFEEELEDSLFGQVGEDEEGEEE